MNNKINGLDFYNLYLELTDVTPLVKTLKDMGSDLLLCQDSEIGFVCPYVFNLESDKIYSFNNSRTFLTVFKNDFILELFESLSLLIGGLRIISDDHAMSVAMANNITDLNMGYINTITIIDESDSLTMFELTEMLQSILEKQPIDLELYDKTSRFYSNKFGVIINSIDEQETRFEKMLNNSLIPLDYDDYDFIEF
jgi:hypothetical protein